MEGVEPSARLSNHGEILLADRNGITRSTHTGCSSLQPLEQLDHLTKTWAAQEAAARATDEAVPGTIAREAATGRGWYPHDKPFRWPEKRTPEELNALPKPSEWRIEQLRQPWEEGTLHNTTVGREEDDALGREQFRTRLHALVYFEEALHSYRSVHLMDEEEIEAMRKAMREFWNSKPKPADGTDFNIAIRSRPENSKVDSIKGLLTDPPQKKAFKDAKLEEAPVSVFLEEKWVPAAKNDIVRHDEKERFVAGDFSRFTSRDRSDLHKRGQADSWGPEYDLEVPKGTLKKL